MRSVQHQNGVVLVAVIFLIVVIGAALTVMARLSVESTAQITQSLLQARAGQAASGGLEWAIQRLVEDQTCTASTTVTVPAYANYTVTVTCTSGDYNEQGNPGNSPGNPGNPPGNPGNIITLYRLSARAAIGSPDDPDSVVTTVDTTVELDAEQQYLHQY